MRVQTLSESAGDPAHDPGPELQGLLDREGIRECLLRYARGLDRRDLDLLRSAYEPDATDHHGALGDYTVEGLITDWQVRDGRRRFSHHLILNCTIDVDGDQAHAETYFQVVVGAHGKEPASGQGLTLTGGRYVDRLTRRDGVWRISRRVVVPEFRAALQELDGSDLPQWARRGPDDPSYARPLVGPPVPQAQDSPVAFHESAG